MTWIAEDVPWYSVDRSTARVMTDEDYAMSAPEVLGRFETETEARQAVARRLEQTASYCYANEQERSMALAAAHAVIMGVTGVQVYGRYYRVREV
jgi:hypothetical protein